jgi:hypothetical protein
MSVITKKMVLNLAENSFRFAGAVIDKVQINQILLKRLDGRSMWVKRRRRGSRALAFGANLFFRLAGNPVSVVEDLQVWRHQEVASFRLLNGEEFCSFSRDDGSVWLERLPGTDLDTLNDEGKAEVWMFYAAGLEFRRVHALFSPRFHGPWSHGDPNFGNVIVDERNQRVRLIDFETVHAETLSPDDRHADDVAVFLLDLIGGVAEESLPLMATAFVAGYNRPNILALAQRRLEIPTGLGRLWWGIRTEYAPAWVLRRRIKLLSQSLAQAQASTTSLHSIFINPLLHQG